MKKRIFTLALAIIMVLQIMMPVAGFAKENTPEQNKMVKVGTIDTKSYPQLDAKIVQDAIRRKKLESKRYESKMERGAQLFKAPYFPNQDPDDNLKPLIFANVNAIFKTKGLDGGKFDWEGVFGKDSDRKPNKAQIVFEQMDDETSTRTGVKFFLKVDKAAKYTWSDSEGKPTKLPLYSTDLKPYRYEVLLDEDVTEHVKLLTARFIGTEGGYAFGKPDPVTGEIVGNINLDLTLQQIASTKFTSKWNTGVVEAERPTVEGSYLTGHEADPEDYGIFKFPSNDTDKTIIRNDQLDPQNPGEYSEYLASALDKTPKVDVADPDPDATDTYTIDRDNKKISYKGKTYKYDFAYDVINGGKLTMTEVIPVTFDANGGKFASIKKPNAKQEIVKEVDYDGTLTDKAENPTKPGKAFKGWATDKDGKNPAKDVDFANLTAAKTFYAIWSDEDIQAEELKTSESLGGFPKKGDPKFTNDFVPTFDELKAKVKVKNANGNFGPLPDDVKFSIVDDNGTEYDKDSDDLKKFIYEKVKESKADEVSRTETVKAKIKYSDGTEREIEIPIKVLKNIYKGSEQGNKLPHIPENYVKVTIDPTDKARDPQKTYYYVNPKAKVKVPVTDPVGAGDNKFSKWTMKADSASGNGADYTKTDRHQFTEASTITAQYGSGKIKVIYVDNYGKEIDKKYQIAGNDYPSEKTGGLGTEANALDFASTGPKFKGYIYISRDSIKGKHYNDPKDPENLDVVKYSYFKKVTTEEPTNKNVYFPVIFDANGGKFKPDTVTQKTVYVYFDGNDATVEKVTFKEVKDEFEKAYSNPTKDGFDFKEWQNAKTNGTKPADDYEIQFKGWNWDADPDNGYVPETFYANYSAKTMDFTAKKVWDLQGATVADDEYPTMNFTLYRKVEGSTDDPDKVDGAEVKEITKDNVTATWKDLLKTNSEGKEYTYFVKETFKNTDIKNDNWITGEMVTKTEGEVTTNSITNKLKTVSGQGETPDDKKNFAGKLTVKKVLENEPVLAQPVAGTSGFRKVPAAPIKFKFKVTGPYGYIQEFELEAGKEKEIKDLAYGQYTVEEIESNNYTAKYVEGEYTKGTSTLSDKPANVEISKANGEKTVTVVNQNLEKPDPNFVTLEATKIWVNGPADDHKEVTINVYRQVGEDPKEKVEVKAPAELKVVRDKSDNNKFYYTWTNLPKHDKYGKAYTYTVEEANTIAPTGEETDTTVKVGDNTYKVTQVDNTITNTYEIPKTDNNVIGKKVWEDVPAGTTTPTVKLELWRKTSDADQGTKVIDATALDANNQADFGKQDKTDNKGNQYTYFVKEVDENGAEFKDPKYTSVVNGLTATNTKIAEDGKLTITKKLENVPVRMMMRGPAVNADPIKFKFTVTKPDGTSEEFELAANGTKTLENLPYGEYTIKETDTKGYTPFYAKDNEEAKQTQEFKVTINSADGVNVTVTNKNIINQNDLTVRATKIWVGGPITDHTAVSLTLKRLSAKAGSTEEDVSNQYSAEAINNTSDSITYVWKNLPKHDGEGYAYTYRVEELGTASDPTSSEKIYKVGNNEYISKIEEDAANTANETTAFKITNTYVVPKTAEDIVATKKWIGVPDGTKTPAVKFQLQRTANGVTEDIGDAMALTNNQVNFGKQDKTDKAGNVYTFSVKEVNADGSLFNYPNFTSEVNGLTVTNTYHAPEVKYTVTYKAGSPTARGTMADDTDVRGTYTVKANGFTNDGYTFKGWKLDNGSIVQPGATINVTADVTLTAQWERTTTPPTPPTPPNPDYPNYPDRPYIPSYPEVRYETIVQEKIVKVPVSSNAYFKEVRYMQGFEGKFRPFDGLTRAEAAQILANALKEDGYKYDPNYKISYKDIGNAWYTEAVKIVTQANVFKGYDDGNFKPQEKITRAEWIGTLKRFQELRDLSGNHMNLREGHWAMAEIEAAYQAGWLAIYSDGLADFKADEFIPRQEVAAVSNKAFERVLDKTYIKRNDKALVNYKDINDKMWSYEDILCASNTFLHDKKLYRAHGIDMSNEIFNINLDGFTITKDKFQRIER